MKVIEPLEHRMGNGLVAAKKDGSYLIIPTQRVICYDGQDHHARSSGVGLEFDKIAKELQEQGEVHISRNSDYKGPFDTLKAKDIVELYSIRISNNGGNYPEPRGGREIVPPKSGLRRLLWRLSML